MCDLTSHDRLHGTGKSPKKHTSHMNRLRDRHVCRIRTPRRFASSIQKDQGRVRAAYRRRRRRTAAHSTPPPSPSPLGSASSTTPSPPPQLLARFQYFPRLPTELQLMVLSHLLVSANEIPIDDHGRPSLAQDLVPPPDNLRSTLVGRYAYDKYWRRRPADMLGSVTVTSLCPNPTFFSSTWLTNYLLVSRSFHDMCSSLYFTRNVFGLHVRVPLPGLVYAPGPEEFLHGRLPAALHLRTSVRCLALHLGGLVDGNLSEFLSKIGPSLRSLIPNGELRRLYVILEEPSSSYRSLADNYSLFTQCRDEQGFRLRPKTVSKLQQAETRALGGMRKFFHCVVPQVLRLLRGMVRRGPDGQGDGLEMEGRLLLWAPYHLRQFCRYHEKGLTGEECEEATFQLSGCKTELTYLEVDLPSLAARYPLWQQAGDHPRYRLAWNIMNEGV